MKSPNEFIGWFLEKNPKVTPFALVRRSDGRIEWLCEHGVGHTIWSPDDSFVHGCDGCCKKVKIK